MAVKKTVDGPNKPIFVPFLIVFFLFIVLLVVFGFLSTKRNPNLDENLSFLTSRLFNKSCSECPITPETFKEMICDQDKFVLIVEVNDVGSVLSHGEQWLTVTRRTTLKYFKKISPKESTEISQLEVLPRDANCSLSKDLIVDKHYLITGNISRADDMNHRHLTVGQCDIFTLWSGLDGSYQEDWIMFFHIKNCPFN